MPTEPFYSVTEYPNLDRKKPNIHIEPMPEVDDKKVQEPLKNKGNIISVDVEGNSQFEEKKERKLIDEDDVVKANLSNSDSDSSFEECVENKKSDGCQTIRPVIDEVIVSFILLENFEKN